jgi:hypothetical protein
MGGFLEGFLQLTQQPEPLIRRLAELVESRAARRRRQWRPGSARAALPAPGIPAATEHADPAIRGKVRSLGQQCGLACARGPGNKHDTAAPGAERVQPPAQHIDLGLPATQSGRHRAIVVEIRPAQPSAALFFA